MDKINLEQMIYEEWQNLKKTKTSLYKTQDEVRLLETLSEKEKLLYKNIISMRDCESAFQEKEIIIFVLKYISKLCNPPKALFFD